MSRLTAPKWRCRWRPCRKRLKEAFEVARRLTYEEATKQRRYYDRRAGAVTLQPGDVVMVRTDSFVGKRKVKDRWEDGGFIVESQLGDWPVYKVRCHLLMTDRNQIPDSPSEPPLLVADEDVDDASGHAQAKATPTLRMPPMRPCQLEWALRSPYLPW